MKHDIQIAVEKFSGIVEPVTPRGEAETDTTTEGDET